MENYWISPARKLFIYVLGSVVGITTIIVTPLLANTEQPYIGQEDREVSSLSEDDINALLSGEGWGLAKPAELNGFPGPAHVLEFSSELELSDEQRLAIQNIFNEMNQEARNLGDDYVQAEKHIDALFKSGNTSSGELEIQLKKTAEIRAKLRFAHLEAHLLTTPLLTQEQVTRYQELRGYRSNIEEGSLDHNNHSNH